MPLDAICLSAVREEQRITGMKIDKVFQPERDVFILALRGQAGSERLLISLGSGDARVHLTKSRFENPESPPMFCMLLRKHLIGARITGVVQPPAERVLHIELDAQDALGMVGQRRVILELMGRYSNIILTDGEGVIIDCLRRIGGEMNDKRRVLPGLFYVPPPPQAGKIDPLDVTQDMWQALYDTAGDTTADKWLLGKFAGLSPLICRELSWRAYGVTDYKLSCAEDGGAALKREFFTLMEKVKTGQFTPCMVSDEKKSPREFSYTRLLQYEGALDVTESESFSELLEEFYTSAARQTRINQRASAMTKSVRNARDRLARKLEAQSLELAKTADRALLRECGDLITANLHAMKKGMHHLEAQDYFAPEGGIRKVTLDPLKTPQQNAAKYYKDYTKAKNAEKYLTEQITLGQGELKYLESVLGEIAIAEGESDLLEIRRELYEMGYLKQGKREQKKIKGSAPRRYKSSAGFEIYAGRNNLQNDKLTFKSASKTDIWLHAKNIHGSHVVIMCEGKTPDSATLHEAAVIAAWQSQGREDGKVAVDYCYVKHVKKPPGSRPGSVIYTDFKTLTVNPDEAIAKRLKLV